MGAGFCSHELFFVGSGCINRYPFRDARSVFLMSVSHSKPLPDRSLFVARKRILTVTCDDSSPIKVYCKKMSHLFCAFKKKCYICGHNL